MESGVDQGLVADLAMIALTQAAPEELAVFDDTATDFFRDPQGAVAATRRDEPVGFGLDAALLTPYVLAVAIPVVQFLANIVIEATRDETKSVVTDLVRRLFRRPDQSPSPPPPVSLTSEQAVRVRHIAYERALSLGLPVATAGLLADSVGGGLLAQG